MDKIGAQAKFHSRDRGRSQDKFYGFFFCSREIYTVIYTVGNSISAVTSGAVAPKYSSTSQTSPGSFAGMRYRFFSTRFPVVLPYFL